MERIHRDARSAHCGRDPRVRLDDDLVGSRLSRVGIVREGAGDARWNVLDQRTPECNIQKLGPAADCQNRFSGLARRQHKSYLSLVAQGIDWPEPLVSLLSVERRIDIFATSENEAIGGSHDAPRRGRARERWNDDWYEPCQFKSSYVGGVEPNAMGAAKPRVGCRGDGNGVGHPHRGIVG